MSAVSLSGFRPSAWIAIAVGALSFAASGARAASISVMFNGPMQGGQHYGISEAAALGAMGSGVSQLPNGTRMFNIDNVLSIVPDFSQRSIDETSLHPPFETSSTWDWTARDVFGSTQSTLYLVFTTVDSRTVNTGSGTQVFDYDESKIGLRIDGAAGWSLLRTSATGLGTLYYPAVALGMVPTSLSGEVDVRYVLEQLLTYQNNGQTFAPLPQLRVQMAVVPIPEPGTAFLLAVGLFGLAARARARS